MNTRGMATRRLEEERVNEEVPPRVKHVQQGVQVPPQGYHVRIVGEGNEVPVVPPKITIWDTRETLLALA